MNNRLDLNQQEKISNRYHDHPLLCACQLAFRNYQARMQYLMFSPIEVFVEAIEVIDNILEDGTDRMDYIRNLWENLTIRYKLWRTGAPNDYEFQIAVSSVFYAASITLSTHNQTYYNETIKDALIKEIDSHTSVVKQEEDRVIIALSQYADELKRWLNSYSLSNSYLSDDIDDIAHNRKPRSLKAVHSKNKNKRINKLKKPKPDYSKFSFELKPKGRFKAKKDKALEWLHDELIAKQFIMNVKEITIKDEISHLLNIEDKNKLFFNAVFSGVDTDYNIVWIGTAKELGYFINQLEERGVISWKEGPRKWQVTRNRIWQGKKEYEINEATGKNQYRYMIEPFKVNAFDKNLVPADTSKLDSILDVIAPIEKKKDLRIEDEIVAEFKNYSDFEGENDNDRGEKLSEGYRDTSHKGRE